MKKRYEIPASEWKRILQLQPDPDAEEEQHRDAETASWDEMETIWRDAE